MEQKLVTKEMVDKKARNMPYLMVVIYADWCGHCVQMKEKLGEYFQQYDILNFLEESEVDPELKDYFPHVHIYKNGKRQDGSLEDVYELIENYKETL